MSMVKVKRASKILLVRVEPALSADDNSLWGYVIDEALDKDHLGKYSEIIDRANHHAKAGNAVAVVRVAYDVIQKWNCDEIGGLNDDSQN